LVIFINASYVNPFVEMINNLLVTKERHTPRWVIVLC
jgi:hypothetical protein